MESPNYKPAPNPRMEFNLTHGIFYFLSLLKISLSRLTKETAILNILWGGSSQVDIFPLKK